MITLELSELRASYLLDIIDLWQEQHVEVMNEIELAEPFDTPEDMLETADNFRRMIVETVNLREDLYRALRARGALP